MGVHANERPAVHHSAQHYRKARQELVEEGPVKKLHGHRTKLNIWGVMVKWTRHCHFLQVDRLDHLVHSTREDIMIFLRWMLDTHPRIRKRSTVHEYKRVFCMLYRKSTGKKLTLQVNEEILDYINGCLTITYGLETTTQGKPVMNVDDVYLVLHHHWVLDTSVFPDELQRLQLALLLLLQAYTATRPGALVSVKTDPQKLREHYIGSEKHSEPMDLDIDDIRTICFRDIVLLLLPNPEGGRDVLAMEVKLRFTKGFEKRPNPKTFILTETGSTMFDAILLMINAGLLADAFESNIKSLSDVYRIRVKPPKHSYTLRWKTDKLDIPVFRQPVMTEDGVRTSDKEPLRYHTYLYYLQRLGLLAGFIQLLVAYMIRRGAGEAVEGVATQAQLQQVMSHRDAGVYQAYINERVQCDVQAAFLGRPSSDALFRAVTHMSRDVDPRAPTELSPEDATRVRSDAGIVKLQELRDRLSKLVKSESKTIKKAEAEATKTYQMYKKANKALNSAKKQLKEMAKKAARGRYFRMVDTEEINKQLEDNDQFDLGDQWQPPAVEHQLEERRKVAALICADTTDLDDGAKLEHRIRTGNALLALCRRKEPRRQQKAIRQGTTADIRTSECPPTPQGCTKTQCVFCVRNGDTHHFSSVYKTRDHVEIHLSTFGKDDQLPCPWQNCKEMLEGHMHFRAHLAVAHLYDVFGRRV